MSTTLELYLEHQMIRGNFRDEEGQRVIDLLNALANSAAGSIIHLSDAWSASLHVEAPASRLHSARIRRAQVLLVVPPNPTPQTPQRFRRGFIEKQSVSAILGIGPFSVNGTLYIGLHEQITSATLEHDPTGRFFIPVTKAVVSSHYSPRWSITSDLMFVNRGAIGHTTLLQPQSR